MKNNFTTNIVMDALNEAQLDRYRKRKFADSVRYGEEMYLAPRRFLRQDYVTFHDDAENSLQARVLRAKRKHKHVEVVERYSTGDMRPSFENGMKYYINYLRVVVDVDGKRVRWYSYGNVWLQWMNA